MKKSKNNKIKILHEYQINSEKYCYVQFNQIETHTKFNQIEEFIQKYSLNLNFLTKHVENKILHLREY